MKPNTIPPRDQQGFNLSAWSIGQMPLMFFLMLVTLVGGAISYSKLSRNEDPTFTIKTMVVAARWPGATIDDTTKLLTDRLEKKLEEIPYLDRLDSYTRPGETVIMVNLRDDAPSRIVPDAWYQVRKKMADITATLPSGVEGPFFDDEFGDTYGQIFGFTAEGFSDRELRDYLEGVRAELLRIPGIGKVQLLGVQEEQIVIEFSPGRLAAFGLDEEAVLRALKAQNAVIPSGTVRLAEDKIALRVSGGFASEESLRNVTLRANDRFVPLTELAVIQRIPADPPAPLFRVNGEKALGLAISMASGGNLLSFGEAVRARMDDVRTTLPHGIEMIQVADQSTVVTQAVSGFLTVLAEAVAIVLAVSFLSLGARAGLVVSLSIPLVLAMTFIGMELTGIGLQRISLGALIIALGLLVDDAMITVEAMVGKLEEGWNLKRAASFAYESTAFPMLTGTLVMIAGFIPVGFAASSAGEYCYSMFMVVLISLSASWVVAVLFSPLLGTLILPKSLPHHGHGAGRIMQAYERALSWALGHRAMTLSVAVAAFVASLSAATYLEQQFFPPSDRPELLVSLTLPQNASLDATTREASKLEELLKNDPDVERFSTYIGSGAIRFYLPMEVLLQNENVTQTVVVAKGVKERDALQARLAAAFKTEFSGLIARATPLELGPPVGWPLKYRVTGPDQNKVRDIAARLANVISANPDTREVHLLSGEPQRSVLVEVDQTQARALGLSSEDIASAMATIFSGSAVTTVRDQDRLIDVVIRAQIGERTNLATLANLQLRTAQGHTIPLTQIAKLSFGVEDPIVWRRQRLSLLTVQGDVRDGLEASTVVQALAPTVARFRAELPKGYKVETGGAVEEAAKGSQSLLAVLPLTALVMCVLLMVQLRSFSRMFLALAMAPFGLIGVVLAMLPTGTPMGFVAQLGVIALVGMIVRNAIILIEEVDINMNRGESPSDAIMHASIHRARPILLTACAAILGMIPIAPQIFWGPMAYAVIGGLAVATIVTLTVLPCGISLLLQWESRRRKPQEPSAPSRSDISSAPVPRT
ncbi:efflux RND transporter permease subunit [Pseudomonas chlororaphis]|uniref:efflux RND transporter permease subunit n=1 Tax=Pseudomonas chlororaphis TaxID=587753 RepID=UPI0006A5D4D1|nr:efflux RND transporter permease subunit [Pseudomonas chlororaphis]AZD02384.1 RND efflux system, inner membrane transporter [Pseudomonas chlororaphis subsp. chlororaphis]MBM0280438.1 efflux RND transporter permease subunit [Pseudomonas chlororaphis]MDO1504922.1 efflux RND transporter permease subunit [Pseudomonas chlororaphis]ORM44911.1 ACR family transporter [Pseudomonas chlororaphis subsp. chlororaphis]TWR96045.1 efflux RND transporter permease subunit [Pseudomonas chlororaphis subsp. chlo